MPQGTDELVGVLESRDKGLIATAEALLSGAGIPYTVSNMFSRDIPIAGGMGATRILVRAEDAPAALHILRGFRSDDDSPEQPFIVRLLIAAGVVLVPIILAIIYSLNN